MKKRRRNLLTLALALLIVLLVPLEAQAKSRSSGRYLRDVYKTDDYYQAVRYCNEMGMFGTYLNKRDRLQPDKVVSKGEFIDYLYNMQGEVCQRYRLFGDIYGSTYQTDPNYLGVNTIYDRDGIRYDWYPAVGEYLDEYGEAYPSVDYYYTGSSRTRGNFSRMGDQPWRWALSAGIISSKDNSNQDASLAWGYDVMNNMAYYVDGGYIKYERRRSGTMHRYDACRLQYLIRRTQYSADQIQGYAAHLQDVL